MNKKTKHPSGASVEKLFVSYEDHCVSSSGDYGKHGPYTGHDESQYEFKVIDVCHEKPSGWYVEEVPYYTDGSDGSKYVHVLVVRYQTGGTFGTDHGRGHIIGVFATSNKANQIAEAIKKADKEDKYWKDEKYNPSGYNPWHGYFERLEDVEVIIKELK